MLRGNKCQLNPLSQLKKKKMFDKQDEPDHTFKIVLLGNCGVGKSAILMRYTQNDFKLSSTKTSGIEFASKKIHLAKYDKLIKLVIWDTAGEEKYKAITKTYFRGAVGALLVYDITNKQSF